VDKQRRGPYFELGKKELEQIGFGVKLLKHQMDILFVMPKSCILYIIVPIKTILSRNL